MGVEANADGSVTVTFDLGDEGASGMARARVVAVREASAGSRDQETGVLSATASGQDVVVSSDLSGATGTGLVYTFGVGQLRSFDRYFFYLACQDAQGWYDAPSGSAAALNTPGPVTGTAIGNNAGLVYDPTPPSINVTDVRAQTDGTLRVTYNLTESGNSELSGARLVASATPMTRDQVLAASGASVADVTVAGADVALSSQVATLSGLTNWTSYLVYYAASDNQGWYDNGSFTGGNALSRAIDSNGGRTWDQTLPTISITGMTFTDPGNSNNLRVTVSITDGGNSGIERATVFLRESGGTNSSISQDAILFGSGSGQRVNLLTNTSSDYSNSLQQDFALSEYTQYHAYAAILDNQGNYDGSPATADGNHDPVANPLLVAGQAIPNGGRTYDITKPAFGLTDAQAQSDGSVVVSYTLDESGGAGLNQAVIYATTSGSGISASGVLAQATNVQSVPAVGTGSVTFSAAQLSSQWTPYYFFAAALDNQGWYNTSGSFGDDGTVSGYSIQNNGNRTWDRTAPSLDAGPSMTLVSGSSVNVAWSGATDSMSGLDYVKIMVTTSSAAFASAAIATAVDSGSAQRVATSASAAGDADVAGLQTGATVYGWAVAVDNQGNVSAARRTSPISISLDTEPPVATWVSGSQTGNTTATVTIDVSDNLTGVASGTLYVRRSSGGVNDYSGGFTGTGNKVFSVTGLQSFTDYEVVVTATDGAGNATGETTVQTFRSWDATNPSLGSTTVGYSGTDAVVSYSVSDAESGLRSLVVSGDASGSVSLSGSSAASSLNAPGLAYGSNTNVVVTVTDRAATDGSYLSSKGSDNSAQAVYAVAVPFPAPSFSFDSVSSTETTITVEYTAEADGGTVYLYASTVSVDAASTVANGVAVPAGASQTFAFTSLTSGTEYHVGGYASNGDGVEAFVSTTETTIPVAFQVLSSSGSLSSVSSSGVNGIYSVKVNNYEPSTLRPSPFGDYPGRIAWVNPSWDTDNGIWIQHRNIGDRYSANVSMNYSFGTVTPQSLYISVHDDVGNPVDPLDSFVINTGFNLIGGHVYSFVMWINQKLHVEVYNNTLSQHEGTFETTWPMGDFNSIWNTNYWTPGQTSSTQVICQEVQSVEFFDTYVGFASDGSVVAIAA